MPIYWCAKNDVVREIAFSVLMPTYNRASFIRRSIASLFRQSYNHWELIIIDDGSADNTHEAIADYISDRRVTYIRSEENLGLGKALNMGLAAARYGYIAYLPSDDCYDSDHLHNVAERFVAGETVAVVYSGIRYDVSQEPGVLSYRKCKGAIPGYSPQLVQVAHVKTADRWTERGECVSEDLFFLFWRKLMGRGDIAFTNSASCEWTCHPEQRHKICGEKYGGGLNKYRAYYHVKGPLRFRCTSEKTIDEFRLYGKYCPTEARNCSNGLKILLVGELAYNPDRIVALEEAGHKLYGLWAKPRFCYSTVGPLPFGHVTDIPYEHWREQVEEIKPDIIYALLSTSAIDIVHEVVTARTGIPLVWHFKEGPHEAMKAGLWDKLMEIYAHADGNVFINSEMRDWIDLFCPVKDKPWLLLDGDLPKKESFKDNFSPLLSAGSGEVHTVVAGRLIGVSPFEYKVLAANGVHIHLYNENNLADKRYFRQFFEIDDSHFHIHRHCTQEQWVSEFSQYDAGWLHCIESTNGGDLMRASWADLNIPARINTMVAACVPMIQRENCGNVFAQQRYVEKYAMGITCKNVGDLVMKLRDRQHLSEIRERIWAVRPLFTFDSHVAELTAFFQDVINKHKLMYGHKI